MTAPLKIEKSEATLLRAQYEGVAHDTLRVLWQRKLLIAVIMIAALSLASTALVLVGPRYTGEAIIQFNFTREEPTTGAKVQPIAVVDAIVLLDSAARVIRSRATAGAVVTWLGLENDPAFTRQSLPWRVLSRVRSSFGLKQAAPSDRDLAVSQLMQQITVTNDPRSYLISVAVTKADAELAARLANAVALEYLRAQLLQQMAEGFAAAEREVAELSSVYGVQHPRYVVGQAKLERLEARLSALREETSDEDVVKLVVGQSLLPAEKVMVPSGPNIVLILALTAGAALVAGIWLVLFLEGSRRLKSFQ